MILRRDRRIGRAAGAWRLLLTAGALLCLHERALLSAYADDPSDAAAEGKVVAQVWCSACHRIPDAPAPHIAVGAPDFLDILRDPAKDAAALHEAVTSRHDVMTTKGLRPDEVDSVVCYMLELRSQALPDNPS